MSKAYIVMGDFRGGTTAVAQLLVRMGINMGEELDPNGNYEDLEVQEIFKRIMMEKTTPIEFNAEFKEAMQEREKTGKDFGFKFPVAHLFMPQMLNFFHPDTDVRLIFVFRDPLAISKSEYFRSGAEPMSILWRATQAHQCMINLIQTLSSNHVIHPMSFEQLLTRTEEEIDDLIEFTDMNINHGVREVLISSIKLKEDRRSYDYAIQEQGGSEESGQEVQEEEESAR